MKLTVKGKRVLYIIAQQNFRDEEYQVPKEILQKEGAKITTASITKEEARGMLGARVNPDTTVNDVNTNNFDMLVIAGGSGSPKLADYPEVPNIIRKFKEQNKPIASICLAGYVLARAGILKGKTATVYPADFAISEYRRNDVNYSNQHVVVDGNIITADGPEVARQFGEEIVKTLNKT
jgi:protease I